MLINRPYLPEGMNQTYQRSAAALRAAGDLKKYSGEAIPLEMMVDRCDSAHDLHGTINGLPAVIPRAGAVCSAVSGAEKEIAVLSLVGRPVCCVLLDAAGENGAALRLSRRAMQEKALAYLEETLREGDVIPAVITSMSPIGVFADTGCGVIALLPIRHISVSRIEHPRERFAPHQRIWAAVQKIDREHHRFFLSHKELLGTWAENAAQFQEGETVTGIVRGVKSYGVFVELSPNLTGLAEPDETLQNGQRVSVLIKAILPEKEKVKLHIVARLPPSVRRRALQYYLPGPNLRDWRYSGVSSPL